MKKKIERIDIKTIKDPNIVKSLSRTQIEWLAEDIRKDIITSTSVNGGHLSSNLGSVELTIALYRSFNFPTDKLIFDVGHQSYTNKILTGRNLDHLNEKDGISGLQNREESLYDCYDAGHAGTAVAGAQGFAIARDQNKEKYNVVAVVGDASIVTGLSFEAINDVAARKNKIIIVLNDNEMSISKPSGGLGKFFRKISTARSYNSVKGKYSNAMSKTGFGRAIYKFTSAIKRGLKRILIPTTMFDNIGYTYIGPVNGHNVKAMEKAFNRAKNTIKSAVVHVRTKKGKGYSYAEKDKIGYWHGVTPFDIKTGAPSNLHPEEVSWSNYFGQLVYGELKADPKAKLVVPAMLHGSGLDDCFDDYPSKCIDVGIAEEHALTLSGSLSINGFSTITCIYSTFLQRAYDEVLHDCARMGANMTLLIDRAGLCGTNGETHQGIYDVAFLRSIPNVTVAMPSNLSEGKALFDLSRKEPRGVFAIRYPHSLEKKIDASRSVSFAYGDFVSEGSVEDSDFTIVAVGPLGLKFKEALKEKGVSFAYVNPLFLNPISDKLIEALSKARKIVIYDPYGTHEGFSDALLSKLALSGYKGELDVHSVPTKFIKFASVSDQLEECGLSIRQMVDSIAK